MTVGECLNRGFCDASKDGAQGAGGVDGCKGSSGSNKWPCEGIDAQD